MLKRSLLSLGLLTMAMTVFGGNLATVNAKEVSNMEFNGVSDLNFYCPDDNVSLYVNNKKVASKYYTLYNDVLSVKTNIRDVLKSGSNNFVIKTSDKNRVVKVNVNARKLNSGSPLLVINKVIGTGTNVVINFSGYKTVKYTTSDEKIVKVNQGGYLTGVKRGKATVKAVAIDDDGDTYRFTYKVTVKDGATNPASGFFIYDFPVLTDSMALKIGKSSTVDLRSVESKNATAYMSSDPSVVSVTQTGVMKGMRKGVATVTATTVKNGKYYNYRYLITVN